MKYLLLPFVALLIGLESTAQMPPQRKPPPPPPDGSWYFMNIDSLYKACMGKKYMPFDVTTLDGKRLTNASCKGKVTFINFWFEGCQPCRGEFGQLNNLYDSLKDNPHFQFIAITFDPKETLPDFVLKNNIHYPVATVEDQAESKRLDFRMGYPNSIVLDKTGKIAYIGMKAITNKDAKYEVPFSTILSVIKEKL